MTTLPARPTLEQQIAACVEAAEIAEHVGDWDTSQRLAAAAETLRALVPRLIEPVRTGAAMTARWEALRAAAEAAERWRPLPWYEVPWLEGHVTTESAAYIAAASPSEVLALLDELAAAEARAARLEAAHDSLFEERGRLRKALFELYNLLAVLKFEPDEGQPHPLKDGVADRIMASANRMLQDAALSAQEDAGNGR